MFSIFREKLFKQSLAKLKEEVIKANAMVREANFLAEEMGKDTEFSVTLQIPAANLTPNRKVRMLFPHIYEIQIRYLCINISR